MNKIIHGNALDVLKTFEDGIVQTCITSPPYWGLRDYGVDNQLGLEKTPEEYVAKMVTIFREVRRVLRADGTVFLNLGDSYMGSGGAHKEHHNLENNHSGIVPAGLKPKDLVGIPWMVAFALRSDGWYLRQDIIWHKPNPMPESVTDRCTKAHEYIFLMSKSAKYYYDADVVREITGNECYTRKANVDSYKYGDKEIIKQKGSQHSNHHNMSNHPNGRNKRSVWTVNTQPYPEAHFATFPEKLIEPCVLAGSPEDGLILDPFMGSGTVANVALRAKRKYLGIELNQEYIDLAEKRIAGLKNQEILL